MQALSFTQSIFSSLSSLLFSSLLLSSRHFASLLFSVLVLLFSFLFFFLFFHLISFLLFSSLLLFSYLFSSFPLSLIVSSLFTLCCRHFTGFEMNNAVRSAFSDLFTFLACIPNWNVLRLFSIIRHLIIWHFIFWYACYSYIENVISSDSFINVRFTTVPFKLLFKKEFFCLECSILTILFHRIIAINPQLTPKDKPQINIIQFYMEKIKNI